MNIEMPTLESCAHCKKPMVGEKAYYSITDVLGCHNCTYQVNMKFLNTAAVGKIRSHRFKNEWKKASAR